MELTKEYFDERLDRQTNGLKAYVDEALAAERKHIDAHFDEVRKLLDVRLAVQNLQLDMQKVKATIHID